MATFTVTTTEDTTAAGDGVLSLREAVARANATAEADTILFAPAVEGRTLTLTQGTPLVLTQDVAIDGDRNGDGFRVTVDGDQQTLVLQVAGAGRTDATLTDLGIVRGGFVDDASTVQVRGGGIVVEAGHGLELTGCLVVDCYSNREGGGIFLGRGSSAVITESLIRGNAAFEPDTASGDYSTGGGIHAEGAVLELVRSTVADNRTAIRGGGVHVEDGVLRVVDSTIAGNSVGKTVTGFGGGISTVDSRASVIGSTVTDNFAYNGYFPSQVLARGAGIAATGTLALSNSIVAGNVSGQPAGLQVYDDDIRGTLSVSNGHNLFGSEVAGSAAGDRAFVDPALLFAETDPRTGGGLLELNGGPTPTVALRNGTGNPALSGAEPVAAGSTDQRSAPRPAPDATNPDIGAFEVSQNEVSAAPSAGNDTLAGTAAANTLAGLAGADLLLGQEGADRLLGGDGGDVLRGGRGNDTLDGDAGLDTASYGDATTPVAASLAVGTSSGEDGADRLFQIENLEGGRVADRLEGDARGNVLGGNGGADLLLGRAGDDLLRGGAGADRLKGGQGADLVEGGSGGDLFAYDRLADSAPGTVGHDLVLDFRRGGGGADRIDLSALDARAGQPGNDAFAFLATEGADFTGAGQVRWLHDGGRTLVEASVDADAAAELRVELVGLLDLAAADFVL